VISLPPPDPASEDDLVEALCHAADPNALIETIRAATAAKRMRLAARLVVLLDPDQDDETTARARRASELMLLDRHDTADADPEAWRAWRLRTLSRQGGPSGGRDPFGFGTRHRR
jgi:hypothetical protein